MEHSSPAGQSRQQVEAIFAAIVDLRADERARYLDRVCADAPALRRHVEDFLHAADHAGGFMADPAILERPEESRSEEHTTLQIGPGGRALIAEGIGAVLGGGKYVLQQELGAGAFGTVFLAEQLHPVRRPVALKRLNPGMNSAQILSRFEQEMQVLALMNHPNIARVYDAGQTPAGLPYFVMEVVRGVPIGQYCETKNLDIRRRLELFIPVCHAVNHAHQKGIIHRDLKPSNIMVAEYDGVPIPKVIDFGIAKAVGEPLTERTPFTTFGGVIGTLQYMSPEQAKFNALDIDIRTDIYALGAVLYELLTGEPPLRERLTDWAAFDELLRVIREDDPPTPSSKVSSAGRSPSSVKMMQGHQGSAAPSKRTRRIFRAELDWVVMKALEKDRARRYGSANGLADDIQCYLDNRPVGARPQTLGYLAGKLARRHRGPVIAVAAVLIALVGGMIGTTIGYFRAEAAKANETAQRLIAENASADATRERDAAIRQTKLAEAAATRARAFSAILESSLLLGEPLNANSPVLGMPARNISDLASILVKELDGRPDLPPDVRGVVYSFAAKSLASQPKSGDAVDYARKGRKLLGDSLPPDAPELIDADLAVAQTQFQSRDYAGAREVLNKIAPMLAAGTPFKDLRRKFLLQSALLSLANQQAVAGNDYAEKLVAEMESDSPKAGGASPSLMQARAILSITRLFSVQNQQQLDAALRFVSSNAAEARQRLGDDSGLALMFSVVEVAALVQTGHAAEAETSLARLIPASESAFGANHVITAQFHVLAAAASRAQPGKEAAAEAHLAKARDILVAWSANPRCGMAEMQLAMAVLSQEPKQLVLAIQKLDQLTRPPGAGSFDSSHFIEVVFGAIDLVRQNKISAAAAALEPAMKGVPPQAQLSKAARFAEAMGRMTLFACYADDGRFQVADTASSVWLARVRSNTNADRWELAAAIVTRWMVLFVSSLNSGNADALVAFTEKELSGPIPGLPDTPENRTLLSLFRGIALALDGDCDRALPLLLDTMTGLQKNPMLSMFPETPKFVAIVVAAIYLERGDTAEATLICQKYGIQDELKDMKPLRKTASTNPSRRPPSTTRAAPPIGR